MRRCAVHFNGTRYANYGDMQITRIATQDAYSLVVLVAWTDREHTRREKGQCE